MSKYLCIIFLFLAGDGVAQISEYQGGEFQPYEELQISNDAEMQHLNRRVIFFVHFTCPYCRNAHGDIRRWGTHVPAGFQFEVVPAVGTKDHLFMAIGYYSAMMLVPNKMEEYEAALYRLIQDGGRSENDPDTYVQAALRLGIPEKTFVEATRSKDVKTLVTRAAMLTNAYGLQEVPVVVLGNRYLTKPASVQNQSGVFITVLNGLFSMLYEEQKGKR